MSKGTPDNPPLPILTYHSLDESGSVVSVHPHTFADQMVCLANEGFKGVSLRQALDHRESSGAWPRRTVVITFDDGYANLMAHAMPTLAEHRFSATVFLVTAHMAGINDWAPPPTGLGAREILSWKDAARLVDAGWEIGAHTRTHPNLGDLSDTEAEEEITGGQKDITDRLGKSAQTFAYPFGVSTLASRRIVAGIFHAGCTTVLRRASGQAMCDLPRIDMFYVRAPRDFRRLVHGRLDGYLTLRRWGRHIRSRLSG